MGYGTKKSGGRPLKQNEKKKAKNKKIKNQNSSKHTKHIVCYKTDSLFLSPYWDQFNTFFLSLKKKKNVIYCVISKTQKSHLKTHTKHTKHTKLIKNTYKTH